MRKTPASKIPTTTAPIQSKPQRQLLSHLKAMRLPEPILEYRFHPIRRWRFDLAWPVIKLAVEIQGGGWVKGKHHRPLGHKNDCEKAAHALMLGWRVLWLTPEQITSGEAVTWIQTLLEGQRHEAAMHPS